MRRITISDDMSFEDFRPHRKRGGAAREEELPEVYQEPVSPKYRAIERDEPYLIQKKKTKPEQIMSKDFEIMTDEEAEAKFAIPTRPEEPVDPAPIPDEADIVASEDELPEEIDEADIPDMDVPEEERPEEQAPEEPKVEAPKQVAPRAPAPAPRKRHRKSRSPISEQVSGMPFLSQATVEANETSLGKILLVLGGIALFGGIVYFLKRGR